MEIGSSSCVFFVSAFLSESSVYKSYGPYSSTLSKVIWILISPLVLAIMGPYTVLGIRNHAN